MKEEVLKFPIIIENGLDYLSLSRKIFDNAAKWQQEQDKKLYTEQEVKDLLETQRGNCYVALLSHTKNEDIASVALGAPEPGGRNGTWVK